MKDFEIQSVTVEIEVPAPFAWSVLLDYASYPLWNPYTVRVESSCRVGDPVDLYLPDPARPGELLHQREFVVVNSPPRHFAYEMRPTAELAVGARRDQYIEERGSGRCNYWTTDVFTGRYAEAAFAHSGTWVKQGFDAVALALKGRAEALFAALS
ncbi:MAG: SRPBCC domain-containing protein [Actinomycetota bacterium]|nr:SRPBCC domain-containing protein [Actinomycetota bacterium]